MKIVLATGIYPPEIGGPATYAHSLASELSGRGVGVAVVTYAHRNSQIPNPNSQTNPNSQNPNLKNGWEVVRVSKAGGPLMRWWRYARALRRVAGDADAVVAFSSVSCGVPLVMARLKGPKKILRLGGDFFWERYTDQGGMKSLRDWYSSTHYSLLTTHWLMQRLLRAFDHVAFSTRFQEGICEKHCRALPLHSVIENALPEGSKTTHHRHEPFRLLFMGRFVGFKNLPALLEAVSALDGVTLTLVGDGPMKIALQRQPVGALHATPLREKVVFLSPAHGDEKQCIFSDHDLLVLPSITEISPNVALEARAVGLPVLLTKETGLSERLREGMVVRDLSLPGKIADAIREVMQNYERVAEDAAQDPPGRGWGEVVEEWLSLMS